MIEIPTPWQILIWLLHGQKIIFCFGRINQNIRTKLQHLDWISFPFWVFLALKHNTFHRSYRQLNSNLMPRPERFQNLSAELLGRIIDCSKFLNIHVVLTVVRFSLRSTLSCFFDGFSRLTSDAVVQIHSNFKNSVSGSKKELQNE